MNIRISGKLLSVLLIGLPLWVGNLESAGAAMSPPPPIRVVSTANPALLPLLLAMSRDPGLPVRLIPVSGGREVDKAFASGQADGLLSMTWVAAAEAARGIVPDLTLVSITFWRGFFELAPSALHVSRLSSLTGRNLLVSGPVGGGRDAGPDILFKALMKREGFDSSGYADDTATVGVGGKTLSVTRRVYADGNFRIYYMPVKDAAKALIAQNILGNGEWDTGKPQPASGLFMVEPAATGIVLNGYMKAERLTRVIDVQRAFTGYRAWPAGELPLGGLSLRASVLNDPARAEEVRRLRTAYEKAAFDLMAARGHPLKMARYAMAISTGVSTYYQRYGLSLPALVIAVAIHNGNLVYRTDLGANQLGPDLQTFEAELLGSPPPDSFYAAQR